MLGHLWRVSWTVCCPLLASGGLAGLLDCTDSWSWERGGLGYWVLHPENSLREGTVFLLTPAPGIGWELGIG